MQTNPAGLPVVQSSFFHFRTGFIVSIVGLTVISSSAVGGVVVSLTSDPSEPQGFDAEYRIDVWAQLDGDSPMEVEPSFIQLDISQSDVWIEFLPFTTHSDTPNGALTFWDFSSAPRCSSTGFYCGVDHVLDSMLTDNITSVRSLQAAAEDRVRLTRAFPTRIAQFMVRTPNVPGSYVVDVVNNLATNKSAGARLEYGAGTTSDPLVTLSAEEGTMRNGPPLYLYAGGSICGDPVDDPCDYCQIFRGNAADCNSNGIPDNCEDPVPPFRIVWSDPAHVAIDARQDHSSSGMPQGINQARIRFSCVPRHIDMDSITLESTSGAPPSILSIIPEADLKEFTILFADSISPGEWTTIIPEIRNHGSVPLESGFDRVHIGFLPGDVNGSQRTTPTDILDLVDHLNGVRVPALELSQCDIDRTAICAPADIVRLIDLLNGVNSTRVWLGQSLPPIP